MNTFVSALRSSVVRGLRALRFHLRVYLIPFLVCAVGSFLYLTPFSLATQATGSALVVLALLILPGVVTMLAARTERQFWWEYALVWLMFVTAMPIYGPVLFVLGHGLVFSRAWRRKWPHIAQSEQFEGLDGHPESL